MMRSIASRIGLAAIIVVVLAVFASAQNKTVANMTSDEYSQLMIQRYNAITFNNNTEKNVQHLRAKHNLTMLLVEARKNYSKLNAQARAVFKVLDARPAGLNQVYTETTKNFFRFYYTTSGTNAVTLAYVQNMAAAFCKALAYYDSLGFNRPPLAALDNGKYSVYVSSSEAGDYVYGYSMPETSIGDNPLTPINEQSSTTSYMVMRSEYDDFGNTAAEKQIAMEVTAAHEFFHAVQFGYEYDNMEGYLMEMASTWAEDRVFPGDDDNWQYLTDIFGTPDVSTDWDEYLDGDPVTYSSDFSMHWYAAWIFMRYLTDHYGDALPKAIFEANITNTTSGAINTALVAKNSTYTQELKNYYIALGLLTQSAAAPMNKYSFSRANDYRTKTVNSGGSPAGPFVVKYENSINYTGTPVTYTSTTKGNKRLMRASADFIKIIPNGNFSVSVTPKTTNASFDIRLIKSNSYTNPTALSVAEPVASGSTLKINVNDQASYASYVLVIYNAKYSTAASRDTASTQYDIVVDKAAITDGVSLTAPVGGESWQIGSVHAITWESANVSSVKLEYSSDNGSNWNIIAASVSASAGTYAWTIPATASAVCKVKVSDAANAASFSVSPAVFSIIQPLPFGIISPNGGESWQVGSVHPITWNPNTVANVKIEYTTNSGTDWTVVAASVAANNGSYNWTVPNTLSAACKVRLTDVANAATVSTSAAVFSIVPAVVVTTVLTEDFVKVTTGTIGGPTTTDVAGSLDTYTTVAGWTGEKIYLAGGALKLGSSTAGGAIVTPAINLSAANGKGTVSFDVQAFGTDTTSIQVLLSTDGGTTYTQVGANVPVTAGMVNHVVAYTGGNSTAKVKIASRVAAKNRFYLDNIKIVSGVTGNDRETAVSVIPESFTLEQNYPNPFNPSTTFSFNLAERSQVVLTVYNQLGQSVATIANGELQAGQHLIHWDASHLVSGVYFYQLRVGNHSATRKLVLMK